MFRSSARVLYSSALRISCQPCALSAVVSKPRAHSYDHVTRCIASSATHPPPTSEPDAARVSDTAAVEAAERGLRLLRERSGSLEQGGEQTLLNAVVAMSHNINLTTGSGGLQRVSLYVSLQPIFLIKNVGSNGFGRSLPVTSAKLLPRSCPDTSLIGRRLNQKGPFLMSRKHDPCP